MRHDRYYSSYFFFYAFQNQQNIKDQQNKQKQTIASNKYNKMQ